MKVRQLIIYPTTPHGKVYGSFRET